MCAGACRSWSRHGQGGGSSRRNASKRRTPRTALELEAPRAALPRTTHTESSSSSSLPFREASSLDAPAAICRGASRSSLSTLSWALSRLRPFKRPQPDPGHLSECRGLAGPLELGGNSPFLEPCPTFPSLQRLLGNAYSSHSSLDCNCPDSTWSGEARCP
jgi:hypothetical protein